MNDTGQRGWAHAILGTQIFLHHMTAGPPPSNVQNVLIGELCATHLLTSRLPSLCDLVGNVVDVGPKKQMVRSDTGRVVAGVKHVHADRNWPVVQFPGNTVCAQRIGPIAKLPVSMGQRSIPQPTTLAYRDKAPEALAQWASVERCVASLAAETSAAAPDLGRPSREFHGTLLALTSNHCGTLFGHRSSNSFGVVPPAGDSVRRLSLAILPS